MGAAYLCLGLCFLLVLWGPIFRCRCRHQNCWTTTVHSLWSAYCEGPSRFVLHNGALCRHMDLLYGFRCENWLAFTMRLLNCAIDIHSEKFLMRQSLLNLGHFLRNRDLLKRNRISILVFDSHLIFINDYGVGRVWEILTFCITRCQSSESFVIFTVLINCTWAEIDQFLWQIGAICGVNSPLCICRSNLLLIFWGECFDCLTFCANACSHQRLRCRSCLDNLLFQGLWLSFRWLVQMRYDTWTTCLGL